MTEDGRDVAKELLAPLLRARGWMRFLAVVTVLFGISMVFTGWGILIFWLPVWAGVALWQAAGALEGLESGSADPSEIRRGLDRLRLWFVLQGVFTAISVAVTVLFALLGFAMMGGMMFHGPVGRGF